MICRHCNKEIKQVPEQERWITISQNIRPVDRDYPLEIGISCYHLACFIEIAGEEFIPEQYIEVKDNISDQILKEIDKIENSMCLPGRFTLFGLGITGSLNNDDK